MILRDFKDTFSQPERQAIIDKEINKEVDQEIEAEIRARYGGNRMALIQTLQAEGITLERHRQQIRDRIIIGWLRQKNISSELIVSPHRVEVYYLAHREEFKVRGGSEAADDRAEVSRGKRGGAERRSWRRTSWRSSRKGPPLPRWPRFIPRGRSATRAGIWAGGNPPV